jgi:hypothetical protein
VHASDRGAERVADTTARRISPGRRWRRRLRVAVPLLVVVVCALGFSACGGSAPQGSGVASLGTNPGGTSASGSSPSTTATTPAQGAQTAHSDALKFTKCMRSHGLTSFPDPGPTGGFVFKVNSGFDPQSPQVQAAQRACQKYAPGPNLTGPQSRKLKAQLLAYAKCMRSHGVSNFPDPVAMPHGGWGFKVTGAVLQLTSPTYQAANAACEGLAGGNAVGGHPCGGSRRTGAKVRRC